MAPVRTSSSSPPIALGRPAAMPAKIRIEMPLPRPRSVICSPSHIRNIEPAVRLTIAVMRKPKPGEITRPADDFQRHGDAERLEQRQAQRAVARVLRDLAPAGLAFLLQLLEGRHHVGHQLHDDRRGDVRHDAQREHGEARQRPAREHVEQAQDAALLALEQLRELVRVDAGHRECARRCDRPRARAAKRRAGDAGRRTCLFLRALPR